MLEMTCKNHTGAQYLTKNPLTRNLHFIKADPEMVREWFTKNFPEKVDTLSDELINLYCEVPTPSMECPCPFSDLIVVSGESEV